MRKVIMGAALLALWACKKEPEVPEVAPGAGAEARGNDPCGPNTCGPGQVCCNPSCGICTAPDAMCTQQFCDAPVQPDGGVAPLPPAPRTCENVRCAAGTHCELVELPCVDVTCPPDPQCKPDVREQE